MLKKPSSLTPFSVYFVTWNVATKAPVEDLKFVLGLNSEPTKSNLPDLYAIGLQEVSARPQAVLLDSLWESPWVKEFRSVLCQHNFVKIQAIRLQGLVLMLFIQRHHLVYLQDVQTDYTRTGLGGVWGNKGAVTIRLNMCGCSICIVNSHLAAHDVEIKQRIDDYNTIVDSQHFKHPETENILFHDYIFWMGDLNFRLDEYTVDDVISRLHENNLDVLLKKDQLRTVMQDGLAFSELSEGRILFPPTYKFTVGTNQYDCNRKPGWTDRILHKVNAEVYDHVTLEATQLSYDSHELYCQSDHKPVTAHFKILVFQGLPEKYAQFEPISSWFAGQEHVVTYCLPSSQEPSQWDWIGLYKSDFSSLDDYIAYVWASDKGTLMADHPPVSPSQGELVIAEEDEQSTTTTPVHRTPERRNVARCSVGMIEQTAVRSAAVAPTASSHLPRLRRLSEQVTSALHRLSLKFQSIPKIKYSVTFPELLSPVPGRYCLLFLSDGISNVYGMSDTFEILNCPSNTR